MRHTMRAATASLVAALTLTVAACGGDRDDVAVRDSAVGATATPDQPAAAATPLRVTEVDLGRALQGDTAVVEDMDDFAPSDTIHAIVRHEGAAQNATITARWTFQDGQVVDERTETVSPIGTRAEYTHFMIAKPTAWPAGNYTLHILVNGREVETEEFEVKQ
ncbi:MAG TPA: hypothetical protein VGE02_17805 [Gemmatimonadales bacterium]